MTSPTIYHCTPRETYDFMVDAIQSGVTPNVISSPGIGKSSLFRKLARQFNLKLIDHRCSTASPEDFTGLPEFYDDAQGQRRARFAPFDIFPLAEDPVPAGYDGWLLFLDEFNSAEKQIQAAAYKLVLDHAINQSPMHERVAKGMAGNLMTDRAIVEELSTAMQSRVIHLEMEANFEQWLEDVAFAEGYDNRIIAFLSYQQKYLMDFRPDHNDRTFCCPRTWEFVNRLVKDKPVDWVVSRQKLIGGTITSGVAADFVTFCEIQNEVPTKKMILADPAAAVVPSQPGQCWFVVSMLLEQLTDDELAPLGDYLKRFTAEFRVLFYRSLLHRRPELITHPAFAAAMVELNRWLNPERYPQLKVA